MIKEAIATGSTIEEAKEAAVLSLNATLDDEVKFDIIDIPQRKTLGLFGGCPAKVRAYIETKEEPEEKTTTKTISEKAVKENTNKKIKSETNADEPLKLKDEKKPITDPLKTAAAERAKKYLGCILTHMNIEAEMETSDYEGGIEITLKGNNIGSIVGRRGETLDALQYLTVLAANIDDNNYQRVLLNTGDYRNKRQSILQSLAKKIANQAQKTNRNIALEPMNPYERRIIHMTIHDIAGVTSWSIGNEPYRRVVIGTSKNDGKITYNTNNNNRQSGYSGNRRGNYGNRTPKAPYQHTQNYQTNKQTSQSVNQSVEREPKSDFNNAPLYGRIDKK